MLFTLDHRMDIFLMDKDLFGGDPDPEEEDNGEEDHGEEGDFLYNYNINEK